MKRKDGVMRRNLDRFDGRERNWEEYECERNKVNEVMTEAVKNVGEHINGCIDWCPLEI